MNLGSTGLNNGDGSPYLTPHRAKKRKLSQDSSSIHVKQEPGKYYLKYKYKDIDSL